MAEYTIGSLCAGAGGLDLAVEDVFDAAPAWFSQYEPPDKDGRPDKHQWAAQVLAQHWPGVPNLGDLTAIDWTQVEPVNILTAGYPCQPFSLAGGRAGENDRRNLWSSIAEAVLQLRPELVFLENVPGHLSLGFGTVMESLHLLAYDVDWTVLSAASVGAPHLRQRLFILGRKRNGQRLRSRTDRLGRVHPALGEQRSGHSNRRSGDERQGSAGSEMAAPNLRRELPRHEARVAPESGAMRSLESGWQGVRAVPGADPTPSEAQGGAGRPCVVVAATGREGASEFGEGEAVDPGVPGDCTGGQAAHVDAERTRAGQVPGSGQEAGCRVRRAPVCVAADVSAESASGAVRGPVAEVGFDAGRLRVRRGREYGGGPEPVWPAPDPTHLGHELGRQARFRRSGSADRGLVAADASGRELQRRGGRGVLGGQAPTEPREGHQRERAGDAAGDRGPAPADADNAGACPQPDCEPQRPEAVDEHEVPDAPGRVLDWGPYAPAIARWEYVMGRPAPFPTEPGKNGERLSPRFVEWMQGLPAGWVTDTGIPRNAQLKCLGNLAMPQQGAYALRLLAPSLPVPSTADYRHEPEGA